MNNPTSNAAAPDRNNDLKIFVGGITRETTESDLSAYFGKYGTIDSVAVKTDPITKKSKGFAFVVFNSTEAIAKVVAAGEHIINNKKVDVQIARARQGKIFVGGITAELSEDDVKSYFGQYGNVVEVKIPFDKVKNQRRCFCFVAFDSEDVVDSLLRTPKVFIKNVEVDVKKVIRKSKFGQGGRNVAPHRQRRTELPQNHGQAQAPQLQAEQNFEQDNFEGQMWCGNQLYGIYGYGQQQTYENVYGGYNTGYGGAIFYGNPQGYTTNTLAPNTNNANSGGAVGTGPSQGTMQIQYGVAGDSTNGGGKIFKYQPYQTYF